MVNNKTYTNKGLTAIDTLAILNEKSFIMIRGDMPFELTYMVDMGP